MTPLRLAGLRAAATLLFAAFALGGCTVDLPGSQPAPQLFVLTPKSTYPADLPRVNVQLAIDVPVAEAGFNTARIAVKRTPYTLDYFERAAWTDTAPRMVQALLVESFENTRNIVAVARESVALRADYELITDLREFEAEYPETGGKPDALVRLTAKLIKMPQRTIIATTSIERRAPAKGGRIEDAVRAFDVALGKVLKRTVEWTLRTVAAQTGTLSRRAAPAR